MSIAIVVVAYNRPKSLSRLLDALSKAWYPAHEVPLVISIDYSGNNSCFNVAKSFQWRHGPKEIHTQKSNMGLKKHILQCGNYAEKYDGIIMLEDDLFVSPYFFDFASRAHAFTGAHENIAGISLYSYAINEYSNINFNPIIDGYDNYYMQVPSSWGQYWSKKQWQGFKKFMDGDIKFSGSDKLPHKVILWPEERSWKKYFYKYITGNDLYIFYPRLSLSTNCGEIGEHYQNKTNRLQVPLQYGKMDYNFSKLNESSAVYDYTMDLDANILKEKNPSLQKYDFVLDLHGLKKLGNIDKPHTISIKEANRSIHKYSHDFLPLEMNLILGIKGNFFSLAETNAFRPETPDKKMFTIASTNYNNLNKVIEQSTTYKVGNVLLWPLKKALLALKKYSRYLKKIKRRH